MPFVIAKPPFPILQTTHRLARGLVGAWLFTDQSVVKDVTTEAYTIRDWSDNGNHAFADKDVASTSQHIKWVAGQSGMAFEPQYFSNSTTSRVTVNNNTKLDAVLTGNEITFAAWVYIKSLTLLAGVGSWHYVFGKNYDGTREPLLIRITSAGVVELTTFSAGITFSSTVTGPANVSAGNWYHLVGTYSKKNNAAFMYINGAPGTVRTITGSLSTLGTAGWIIGNCSSAATPARPLNGSIDSVLCYNRALDGNEVRALYQDQYQMFRPEPFGTQIFKVNPVPPPVGGTTFNQAVTATAAAATAFVKSAGKIIAATSAGATSWLKSIGKRVNVTSTGTTSATKSITKPIAATSTGTTSVLKSIGKRVLATAAGTATISALKVFLVAVSAACAGTVSQVLSIGKRVSATSTGTTTVARAIGKAITATAAGTVSVLKAIGKRVSAAAAGAVSVVAQFVSGSGAVFNQAVNATASGTVTIRRAVGKLANISAAGSVSLVKAITRTLTVAAAGSVAVVKSITKTVLAACAGAVSATAIKVKIVVISAASSGAVSVGRAVGKLVSVGSSGAVTLRKALATAVTVSATGSVSVVKSITKRVLATVSGIASVVAHVGSTTYFVVVNATVSTFTRLLARFLPKSTHNVAVPRSGAAHHVANPRDSGWPSTARTD